MQINFFTSPEDEAELIDFIEKKGGYFIRDFCKPTSDSIAVLGKRDLESVPALNYVGILSNELLTPQGDGIKSSDLRDSRGFPIVEVIEFNRSGARKGTLYPGRFWLNGLKPDTIRLYKSLCGFIRRKFENRNGWYWGKGVQAYCADNHLEMGKSMLGPIRQAR